MLAGEEQHPRIIIQPKALDHFGYFPKGQDTRKMSGAWFLTGGVKFIFQEENVYNNPPPHLLEKQPIIV